MKTDLSKGFDEYAFRARVLPALVALSPLLIVLVFVGNHLKLVEAFISFCASLGLIYLVSNLVRSMGKKLEPKLADTWGGLPTTKMLRFSTDQNQTLLNRRRKQLEVLTELSLPTRKLETSDPNGADAVYEAAVKVLIAKVRRKGDQFPRVIEENTHYGFRRNLLALKPLALTLITLTLLVAVYRGFSNDFSTQVWAIIGIELSFAFIWLALITSDWVKEVATSYADRLFEALEERI